MRIEDFWHLSDEEFLNSLIPAFAYSEGDHYANPWLLGKVRLILAFPLLKEEEREIIQKARLALEELKINEERSGMASDDSEKAHFAPALAALKGEYAHAMEAVEALIKGGRLTGEQETLLKTELALPLESEMPALPEQAIGAA